MTTTMTIPAHLRPFVEQELADGRFADEAELVTAALEVYRETKSRYLELRNAVDQSLAEVARGDVTPLDMDAIRTALVDSVSEDGRPR